MTTEPMPQAPPSRTAGLVLAAGAGSRMGIPKALVDDEHGSWLANAVAVLRENGCAPLVVMLGARADEARSAVPGDAHVVIAEGWEEGIAASLRAGLVAVESIASADADPDAAPGADPDTDAYAGVDAVAITLVDLPGATGRPLSRLITVANTGQRMRADVLLQAAYSGRPGHPVLIGRDHWAALVATAEGDVGARPYLAANGGILVECGDLESGDDRDS